MEEISKLEILVPPSVDSDIVPSVEPRMVETISRRGDIFSEEECDGTSIILSRQFLEIPLGERKLSSITGEASADASETSREEDLFEKFAEVTLPVVPRIELAKEDMVWITLEGKRINEKAYTIPGEVVCILQRVTGDKSDGYLSRSLLCMVQPIFTRRHYENLSQEQYEEKESKRQYPRFSSLDFRIENLQRLMDCYLSTIERIYNTGMYFIGHELLNSELVDNLPWKKKSVSRDGTQEEQAQNSTDAEKSVLLTPMEKQIILDRLSIATLSFERLIGQECPSFIEPNIEQIKEALSYFDLSVVCFPRIWTSISNPEILRALLPEQRLTPREWLKIWDALINGLKENSYILLEDIIQGFGCFRESLEENSLGMNYIMQEMERGNINLYDSRDNICLEMDLHSGQA